MRSELETSPTSKHAREYFAFPSLCQHLFFAFCSWLSFRLDARLCQPSLVSTCLRIHPSTIASLARRGYSPNPGGSRCASPRKQSSFSPQHCSPSSRLPVSRMDKQSPARQRRSNLRDLQPRNRRTTRSSSSPLATLQSGAFASVLRALSGWIGRTTRPSLSSPPQ